MILLLLFVVSALLWLSWKDAKTTQLLAFFIHISVLILISAYFLSAFNLLNKTWAWYLVGVAAMLLSLFIRKKLYSNFPKFDATCWFSFWQNFKSLPLLQRLFLGFLVLSLVVINLAQLSVVLWTAPHNWDSISCHLPRTLYYWQQGNFNYFEATFWAQTMHPITQPALMLFLLQVSNMNENATQFISFLPYIFTVIAMYGIATKLQAAFFWAMLSACIFGLLINVLMCATTTQNDMLLTCYLAITVYFLLPENDKKKIQIHYAIVAFALMFAVKVVALLTVPALLCVAFSQYKLILKKCFLKKQSEKPLLPLFKKQGIKKTIYFQCKPALVAIFIAFILLLPCGYVENIQKYGHIVGSLEVRQKHGFTNETIAYRLEHGTKNFIRYCLDFTSLDGVVGNRLVALHHQLRFWVRPLGEVLSLHLESTDDVRLASNPFRYNRLPIGDEDGAYFGILGFALLLPLSLYAIFSEKSNTLRFFAIAAWLFVAAQAYSSAYDPYRGRYFTQMAVFLVPLVAVIARLPFAVKIYTYFITFLAVFLAAMAVFFHPYNAIFSFNKKSFVYPSVFALSRNEQLVRNRPQFWEDMMAFYEKVPQNAVVAVWFEPHEHGEYLLFDAQFQRKIIPYQPDKKLPKNVDYFVYSAQSALQPNDERLGNYWFLRKIKRE